MQIDIGGKVRNTPLDPARALLPVLEAIVNSFQSIDELPKPCEPYIRITVKRDDDGLFSHTPEATPQTAAIRAFIIEDNGVGFTSTNFKSFFTADSPLKQTRGGKGVGRFLWLRAFERARIVSVFEEDGLRKRQFDFTIAHGVDGGTDIQPAEGEKRHTTVSLIGLKAPYKEAPRMPRGLDTLALRIIEHCLLFLMNPDCPSIILEDESDRIDLNARFREHFSEFGTKRNFNVGDEQLTLTAMRLFQLPDLGHELIYAAHSREVRTERLAPSVINVRGRLDDGNGRSFAYVGIVEGSYLDEYVASERGGFLFPDGHEGQSGLYGQITLKSIRDTAVTLIKSDLQPFIEQANAEKRALIENHIHHEAPQFRVLLQHIDDFIDQVPPGVSATDIHTVLYQQFHKYEMKVRDEAKKIIDSTSNEDYSGRLAALMGQLSDIGKSSLAQHVVHRRVIIDLFEKALEHKGDTEKHSWENVVHNLVFPMRTMSDEVAYDQQNLWIIDERLTFHTFTASDKPLNQISEIDNASKLRPDVFVFDHSLFDRVLLFTEGELPLASITLLEFKRPGRKDYGHEDPIRQVYDQIDMIRQGKYETTTGVDIILASPKVPAYAFIICDVTDPIKRFAKGSGLHVTPDGLGYYGYNPEYYAYVEVISYRKVLNDARKRNRVLFDKLHIS